MSEGIRQGVYVKMVLKQMVFTTLNNWRISIILVFETDFSFYKFNMFAHFWQVKIRGQVSFCFSYISRIGFKYMMVLNFVDLFLRILNVWQKLFKMYKYKSIMCKCVLDSGNKYFCINRSFVWDRYSIWQIPQFYNIYRVVT